MNFFEALILGLIQGITEFIPVSSSGHLTLFGKVFDVDSSIMLSFTTLLHVGTLIAVFIVMRKDIKKILLDIFGKMTWLIIIATIPAVIAAVLLGDLLDKLFAGGSLGFSFLMTGLILLSTLMIKQDKSIDKSKLVRAAAIQNEEQNTVQEPDRTSVDKTETTSNSLAKEISYKEALIAGLGQAVAILPGISRSGSTLATLLFCKIDRKKAVRFSFLMSIPAIAGGFLLDIIKMLGGESTALTQIDPFILIVGIAAAFFSGWLAMNYMLKKLTSKGLLTFAIYVIVLGLLVLIDQNWLHLVF
ncbi:MAG: undecaprenyl-diphosphate phosphatase [Clostridiaceae bacterium]|nr:undecaprenyl-diphosphate phosphatase [Clostridiaceae bacterium]